MIMEHMHLIFSNRTVSKRESKLKLTFHKIYHKEAEMCLLNKVFPDAKFKIQNVKDTRLKNRAIFGGIFFTVRKTEISKTVIPAI